MKQRQSRETLVATACAKLKAMILARAPGEQIGSLPEIAGALGVGVVTIQQAARVLEHEGFLKVRRGNAGGYYGARPDSASLSRAIAGYLQVHTAHEREAIEITTLLDCDLMSAAALATDETLRLRLHVLGERIGGCDTAEQRWAFEQEMQDIIFLMVDRPLTETLARVTIQSHSIGQNFPIYAGAEGTARWKHERHRVIHAIMQRDARLARFEAERRREDILRILAVASVGVTNADQTGLNNHAVE